MSGRMEINVLVVIAVEKIREGADGFRQIVAAAKSHDLSEQAGMAQGDIDRMISADAAPMRDQKWIFSIPAHERNQFAKDVLFVLVVPDNPGARVDATAVQAFAIKAVNAKYLQQAALNRGGEGVDQPPVFVIKEAALPRREDQHLRARVTKNQQFHVTVQARAEPSSVLTIHLRSGYGIRV